MRRVHLDIRESIFVQHVHRLLAAPAQTKTKTVRIILKVKMGNSRRIVGPLSVSFLLTYATGVQCIKLIVYRTAVNGL